MNVGSTFSGVGGLDLGLERAGMSVLWQAEIDEWSRRVLRWHWPDTRLYNDVRDITADAERVDLLTGGFPCQDLSVAGRRAGLAGERSGLFHEFARLADELRPAWLLVENVVGLLSSADGRDFGVVLSTLADLGYGLSWRVVDARYFGVPQRRRRVFVVGCFGDDGSRAVRALGAGGEGNLEAGRCSWQTAPRGTGNSSAAAGGLDVAHTLQTTCGDYSRADGFNMVKGSVRGFHHKQDPISSMNMTPALGATSDGMAVSFAQNQRGELREDTVMDQLTAKGGKPGQGYPAVRVNTLGQDVSKPLLTNESGGVRTTDLDGGAFVAGSEEIVRRLTPWECERLMSWPSGERDGWTAVDGDKTPDTRRYAACGNGVVSNVAEWIGRRIVAVNKEMADEAQA